MLTFITQESRMGQLERLIESLLSSGISSQSIDVSPIDICCKCCDFTVTYKNNKNVVRTLTTHVASSDHKQKASWTCIMVNDRFEIKPYHNPPYRFKLDQKYRRLEMPSGGSSTTDNIVEIPQSFSSETIHDNTANVSVTAKPCTSDKACGSELKESREQSSQINLDLG